MEISDIRKKTGLTQKAFAEEYHLPLQTLKQWESSPESTSHRTCPDYIVYYLEKLTEQNTQRHSPTHINMTWEAARHKKYLFPLIYATGLFDSRRVHPLKQKQAVAVAELLDGIAEVESAYIFGSAVSVRCHSGSDVDIAVRISPTNDSLFLRARISEDIQLITDWTADIIWLNDEEEGTQLYNNITEGVSIK